MERRAFLALASLPLVAAPRQRPRQKMIPWRAKTVGGEVLTGESMAGKVVLMQYWATWCKYCQRDEPALETIIGDHAKDGLIVLAINASEPKEKVDAYLKEHKRTAKIAHLSDTDLGRLFGGMGVPAYLLIDRDGKVAAGQEGSGGLLGFREMLKEVDLRKS